MLDSLFENVPLLVEPLVVFRGGGRQLAQVSTGTIFSDKAFVSTSSSKELASSFVRAKGALLKIVIPKGSKVVPLPHMTQLLSEREILLPRNSRFRVVATQPAIIRGRPVTYVEAELLL